MKKYIAIHTYHDSDAKKRFWMGTKHNQTTDIEWAKKWNYKKARCTATWVGSDDFFFCHWIAENEQDIHDSLEKVGAAQYLHTVCYEAIRFNSFFNQTGEPIVYVMDKKRKKKKR